MLTGNQKPPTPVVNGTNPTPTPASLVGQAGGLKEVYEGKGKDANRRSAIQRRLQRVSGSAQL